MDTRKKAIISIALISLLGLVILLAASELVIMESFKALEKDEVEIKLNQATEFINKVNIEIDTLLHYYTASDDTYVFIQDNNPKYIERNFQDINFEKYQLNLLIITNPSGETIYSKAFNIKNGNTNEFLPNFDVKSHTELYAFSETEDSKIGYFCLDGNLFLMASRPIITSQYEGPIKGAMIFGRQITSEMVTELETQSHLLIDIVPTCSNLDLVPSDVLNHFSNDTTIMIKVAESDLIKGFNLLNDITGEPCAYLIVSGPRTIYWQGANSVHLFAALTAIFFAGFGFSTIKFLDIALISRISKLSATVGKITKTKDMNQRLKIESQKKSENDEINQLSTSINLMLDTIREINANLNKSQRFAAIGELAVMVGHDLRNPLQGITIAVDFLSMQKKDDPEKKQKMLSIIKSDVAYCEKIVSDLLNYSREIIINPTKVSPKDLLSNALSHIQVPEVVKVVDFTQDQLKINVDIDKMTRVFDNLIKNAIDAMPTGGTLTVESDSSADSINISFSDTGKGILKEHLEKLFVPLFTTKAKGMGLGLAICKRIIDAHKGKFTVESEVGKGAKFIINLPLANN
jgi:signal transduction histidine kinase